MLSHVFKVKPLSANQMFGHRNKVTFKTKQYLDYQNEIRDTIRGEAEEDVWPFGSSFVSFHIRAGLSNRGADIDNVLKPLLDTYQSIFTDFNDNKVYHIDIIKEKVEKGSEYLAVQVEEWHEEEV